MIAAKVAGFSVGTVSAPWRWVSTLPREALMTHYEIRFLGPEGVGPVTWEVEKPDDAAAVRAALDVCHNQLVEVWDGQRKIDTSTATEPDPAG